VATKSNRRSLELQHLPDGSKAIQWYSYYGQPLARYVFTAGRANGQVEVSEKPFPKSSFQLSSSGIWTEGGVLALRTSVEGTGRSVSHHFSYKDGKLVVSRYDTATGKTLTGKPTVKDFSSVTHTFSPATPELIAEAAAAHERRVEEQRRRAEHEAERRLARQAQEERDYARFMGGLNTFVNTFNDSMAEAREREERSQAFLADVRRRAEEIDRRRVAQQQASVQEPSTQRPIEAPVYAPRETPRQQTVPTQPGRVATTTPSRPEPAAERRVEYTPTLEAIIVCTHPDEQGRFKCDTPVDVNVHGGPGHPRRTPEEFVAVSAACGSVRRLQSTTHLVWGCGYGATNGGNSMDRSAGVDVKGRNTYYCIGKEWPCRRTSPE
jgi:hypothetical protein